MNDAQAIVESTGRRLSPIWFVPLVALALGLWLAVDAYRKQGPTVVLNFSSAQGIQKDKTRVKALSVEVGLVTDVQLNEDLNGVAITVELSPEARELLREDTEFWVVRPRVSGAGISGLGTLLSGAYIEIAPGIGALSSKRQYVGLEQIPATPTGTPGIRLRLTSETQHSVGVGSPILYHGYQVGIVESSALDVDSKLVSYSIFVDAPYDRLVSSNTRFWNASGITAQLNTEGIKLSMGSVQSMLHGGVSFELPDRARVGYAIEAESTFRLYPNKESINRDPHRYHQEYVVLFKQSLRGLNPGAPVTYRGIRIGNVEHIMITKIDADSHADGTGQPIPVLIRLAPGRMALGDDEAGMDAVRELIETGVNRGLRATLDTGNLLTGSLLVGLDFYENEAPEEVGQFLEYPTIPAVSAGFARLQQQISSVLQKINDLPIEQTLANADAAIIELKGALAGARAVLQNDKTQQLPADLQQTLLKVDAVLDGFSDESEFQSELIRTLDELKQTLQSIQSVTDQLGESPNSIIVPVKQVQDVQPKVIQP